jgi:hypothetical protein
MRGKAGFINAGSLGIDLSPDYVNNSLTLHTLYRELCFL